MFRTLLICFALLCGLAVLSPAYPKVDSKKTRVSVTYDSTGKVGVLLLQGQVFYLTKKDATLLGNQLKLVAHEIQ